MKISPAGPPAQRAVETDLPATKALPEARANVPALQHPADHFDLPEVAQELAQKSKPKPTPVPAPSGTIDPKDIPAADWTCFVNLNADNSLESYGRTDLNEMETVGSLAGKMNVIALVDGGTQKGNGWTTGTRLMWVTKDSSTGTISSKEITVDPNSDLGKLLAAGKGELDTGNPAVLHAAMDYVQRNIPSQHFMLDLWDHGNDWRGALRAVAEGGHRLRRRVPDGHRRGRRRGEGRRRGLAGGVGGGRAG